MNFLYNYGIKITSDNELVKDAIHDVFVDIWINRSNLNITKSFRFYALRSLRNRLIRKLKKSNTQTEICFEDIIFQEPEPDLTEQGEKEKRLKEIKENLNHLSNREREIIFLKFFNNFDHEEISSIMEISMESAYNYLSKAIKKLKRYLYVSN